MQFQKYATVKDLVRINSGIYRDDSLLRKRKQWKSLAKEKP